MLTYLGIALRTTLLANRSQQAGPWDAALCDHIVLYAMVYNDTKVGGVVFCDHNRRPGQGVRGVSFCMYIAPSQSRGKIWQVSKIS